MNNTFLPFSKPTIDEATIASVADVLRSGWITSGPKVAEFKKQLSAYFGSGDQTQRVQPASALPDPVLRTELMDTTSRGMDKSPDLLSSQVGSACCTLMQSAPWFGKRDLKRGTAEAGAEQARGKSAATWADLAMQIKSAYAQDYFVAGNQKIARNQLNLMVQRERVAQVWAV